jgi:hypothetical protein
MHPRGQKRSFAITNSWSRSAEKPNNFRVFLFFKQAAISIEEYRAVFDAIDAKLKERFEKSGLDKASRSPVQSYFMPCTNREHQDWYYFKSYGTSKRGIERHGIVPSTYLKTALIETKKAMVVSLDSLGGDKRTIDGQKIEEIKNRVKEMLENRHLPFFNAAVELKGMGLTLNEVEQHLVEIEAHIGKTTEQWTKYAIESIQRYRKQVA